MTGSQRLVLSSGAGCLKASGTAGKVGCFAGRSHNTEGDRSVGIFGRTTTAGDDGDALATAEADVKRLIDTQHDLVDQIEAGRKHARERRDAHRLALVEAPDTAAALGEQALAARTKLEGLEANAVDLDAELGAARIRLAASQEAAARGQAVVTLRDALNEFETACQTAMPAVARLVAATRELGRAQHLDHVSQAEGAADLLAAAFSPFALEAATLREAAERRIEQWQRPPQIVQQPPVQVPAPGPIAIGSERRRFTAGAR
jgi:hypothetical protein